MSIATLYVSTRQHIDRVSPISEKKNNQQRLTEKFLQEWAARREVAADQLLSESLAYAMERVPYYNDYFKSNPFLNPQNLSHWPILNRDHILSAGDRLKATGCERWKTWTHASGGSTGKPVTVVHDEHFAAKASALRKLCGRMFFDGPHYNKLILWGMNKEVIAGEAKIGIQVKDFMRELIGLRTRHINTFEFSDGKFRECVRILRRQKPQFIFGYAGSVYELAKYLDENRIEFPRHVKMIGTTAQTLHGFMREKIEKVFNCRVCDHYGSREVGPLAWQHKNGDMYFPEFFAKLEVVDEDGKEVAVGERGRILVTTLHNFSMPLIRYDIGDTGILGKSVERDGYPFATLKKISGRETEEFINVRGSRVCGPFFINLFYYRPWLDQFHIVQKDYDRIEIKHVLKEGYSDVPTPDRDEIEGRIRQVMSENCSITWTPVKEVPTTKAGKRLFIRREMLKPAGTPTLCEQTSVADMYVDPESVNTEAQ